MNLQQTIKYNHWKTWKTIVFFNKNLTNKEFKRIYLKLIARPKALSKDTTVDVQCTHHMCPGIQQLKTLVILAWFLVDLIQPSSALCQKLCYHGQQDISWTPEFTSQNLQQSKLCLSHARMYVLAWPCIKSDPGSMFIHIMHPMAQDRNQLQPLKNVVTNCWVA